MPSPSRAKSPMVVTLQLRQLDVPPGQRLLVRNLDWPEFERILTELGEHRASRIAYNQGILEIRMPTPEHEVDKELIGDIVKTLLDELEIDVPWLYQGQFASSEHNAILETLFTNPALADVGTLRLKLYEGMGWHARSHKALEGMISRLASEQVRPRHIILASQTHHGAPYASVVGRSTWHRGLWSRR